MKPMKTFGMLLVIVVMCGVFAYVGAVLSHWDDPVQANKPAATESNVQKALSSLQSAALATAQESTELTQ
jgi:hypothetical protein